MIRRFLTAAIPMLALVACGMPEAGDDTDSTGTSANAVEVRYVTPAPATLGPGSIVLVNTPGSPPRLMFVAAAAPDNGDSVSSTQDPIPVREGPGNPPPDNKN